MAPCEVYITQHGLNSGFGMVLICPDQDRTDASGKETSFGPWSKGVNLQGLYGILVKGLAGFV